MFHVFTTLDGPLYSSLGHMRVKKSMLTVHHAGRYGAADGAMTVDISHGLCNSMVCVGWPWICQLYIPVKFTCMSALIISFMYFEEAAVHSPCIRVKSTNVFADNKCHSFLIPLKDL